MSEQPQLQAFTTQLDQEWERLRRNRRSLSTIRSWSARVDSNLADVFRSVEDLQQLVGATQRRNSLHDNQILLALVQLAKTEQLAGRIVVQRILPGLISAAAKYRYLCDGADPAELAVGALWIAIRQYDCSSRQRHVAPSLISDAVFSAFRCSTRRRWVDEAATKPNDFDEQIDATGQHCFEELAAVVGEARLAGVPTYDLDLLRHLVKAGSPGLVAQQRKVSTRTIRNHRARAAERVRLAVGVASRPAMVPAA